MSFKLKPWADRFLVLRMALYEEEYPELAAEVRQALAENESPLTGDSQGNHMPHRGLHIRGFHNLDHAFDYGIRVVYWGSHLPDTPVSDGTLLQVERNLRIRDAFATGATLSVLAQQYQISPQRVHQIVHSGRS